MVASRPDIGGASARRRARLLVVGVTALGVLALATPDLAATAEPRRAPGVDESAEVSLDAASSEVDYRSNTVVFRDVVVTQGGIRVTAEEARATGLDFKESVWTFNGRVRITVDGGALASDRATVNFGANRIVRATIVGNPAQFEQPRANTGEIARGRAGSIEYRVQEGTVTLTRDAWLSDGRNEISGQQLVYDVRGQRVQAQSAPGRNDRVRITIRPREAGSAAPAAPAASPSTSREPAAREPAASGEQAPPAQDAAPAAP